MRQSFTFLALLLGWASACGGATESNLFTSMGGESPDSGPATDSGSGFSQDSSRTDSSDLDTSIADTALPPPVDTGPPPPAIPCGNAPPCPLGEQVCCVTLDPNMITPPTYACVSASSSTACSGGVPVGCYGNGECTNKEICCGTEVLTSVQPTYEHVRCQTSCSESTASIQDVHFCDPMAVPDECAANGMTCTQSMVLIGYYVCR
jgi:hypothetical protein